MMIRYYKFPGKNDPSYLRVNESLNTASWCDPLTGDWLSYATFSDPAAYDENWGLGFEEVFPKWADPPLETEEIWEEEEPAPTNAWSNTVPTTFGLYWCGDGSNKFDPFIVKIDEDNLADFLQRPVLNYWYWYIGPCPPKPPKIPSKRERFVKWMVPLQGCPEPDVLYTTLWVVEGEVPNTPGCIKTDIVWELPG